MQITVNGIRLCYERFDGSGIPTVLLHGWGANMLVMRGIYDQFVRQNKSVVMVDLPYFGQSDPPPTDFGIYDYAKIVAEWIDALQLGKVNLLGHSFGGRIALILAAEYGIGKKMVLTDAAGLKPKRSLRYWLRVWLYKLKKRMGKVPKQAGSTDYQNLPDEMKPVFVRIVNMHLDQLLPRIGVPTLLVWGKCDRDTPLYMAKRMNRKIRDSQLVVLNDAGHFSFLDEPYAFDAAIHKFL